MCYLNTPDRCCRIHNPRPSFDRLTTGRFSRHLPANLRELYAEALSNPDILDLRDQIALLEAKQKDILEGMKNGLPRPEWVDLQELVSELCTRVLTGEGDKATAAMQSINDLMENGMRWDRSEAQMVVVTEQLRRMAETEFKRHRDMNLTVPIERVLVLMRAMASCVKRHVTNPAEIDAVRKEMEMVFHGAHQYRDQHRAIGKYIDAETVNDGARVLHSEAIGIDSETVDAETE